MPVCFFLRVFLVVNQLNFFFTGFLSSFIEQLRSSLNAKFCQQFYKESIALRMT